MASVALRQTFLHDSDDLTNFLVFYTTGRGDARPLTGEVRGYANGRQRLVVTKQKAQSIPATFVNVTRAELDQLDAWSGHILLFRDVMGRMLYGTYFEPSVVDAVDRSGFDVSVTFQRVSRPFGV